MAHYPRPYLVGAVASLDVVAGADVALQVHVDLSAAFLILNLIYELINKVDAAAVVRIDVLADERAGDLGGVETFAGIADHDEEPAAFIASDGALHVLARIVPATMDDGVGERLAQRYLKLEFLAAAAIHC